MRAKAKSIAAGAACAGIGVIVGIAGAAAAPSSKKSTATSPSPPTFRWHMGPAGAPPRGGPGGAGPAVHEDAIVLNRAGTAFIHESEEAGSVVSVSGDQLTIKEGIGKVTYKTVTVTIPSGAIIVRNFAKATLSDLKAGDRVRVTQSSDGTSVFADNGTGPRGRGPGWPSGARGFGHGPSGPPPGAPPGPAGSASGSASGSGAGAPATPAPPPAGA